MEYMLIINGLVEVGDVIQTESWMGKSSYKITRVTKTKSLAKRASDGFEYQFSREIQHDMSKPRVDYNQKIFRVYRPIESGERE